MKKTMVCIFLPFVLIACASTAKMDGSQNSSADTRQSESGINGQTGRMSAADVAAAKLAESRKQIDQLKNGSVYFDFDKDEVKSQYMGTVKEQEKFMQGNANDSVALEGNCDERGSDEYNLALGSRRASAVSRLMQAAGIAQGKIKIVSYGSERPRLACHDEKCWKENRRVDFMHELN